MSLNLSPVRAVWSVLTFSLLLLGLSTASADSTRKPEPGDLILNSVRTEEGTENFSLKINIKAFAENNNGDDNDESYDYGEARKNRLEFDAVEAQSFVQVQPRVDFSISGSPQGFNLIGKFKPETTYKVVLKAGLRTKSGEKLKEDETKEVTTGSLSPKFTFKSKARYIPERFETQIPYESVNFDAVELVVRHVYPQNLHQWLTTGEVTSANVSDEVQKTVVKLKDKKNEKEVGSFSLADVAAFGKGVFEVAAYSVPKPKSAEEESSASSSEEAPSGRKRRKRARRHFQASEPAEIAQRPLPARGDRLDSMTLVITNISAVIKMVDQEQIRIWALSTSDLKPLKGAEIDLISVSNQKIDHCEADGSTGQCTLKWKGSSQAEPYLALIKYGKDQTYVRFSDVALKNDRFQAGERPFQLKANPFDAFVYSARDLYRPGEVVHLSALVRNPKFEAAEKLPVRWRVTNPRGKIVRDVAVQTDGMGLVDLEFPTQASFETGKYMAELLTGTSVLHSMSFLVEEFVPERIGLANSPAKELIVGNENPVFNLKANYLFGPPVAGGEFKLSCTLKPAFNSIPKNPEFKTGIYSQEEPKALLLEPAKGNLDKQGLATAACVLGSRVTEKSPLVYEVHAKAEVNEAGSARVTSKSASTLLASSDALLGVKFLGATGKTIRVALQYFNIKGEPLKKNGTVQLKLFRLQKHWYFSNRYAYDYDSRWKVEELITPTGPESKVTVTNGLAEATVQAPEAWGEFVVRAVDQSSQMVADNNVGYIGYYWGDEVSPKSKPQDPEALKLRLSKTKVRAGEKMTGMVEAPFAGRLLISTEGEKIFETKWIDVQKPGPVEFEIAAPSTLPNFYVSALLLKTPKDAEGRFIPARAWGARSVSITPEKHELSIQIKQPEVTPSQRDVTIQISNAEKESAEYSVAVVDEGILQMTSFASPDPLNRFFDPRRLDIVSLETLGWTFAQTGSKQSAGGDKANGKGKSTMPVKLVAYWFSKVASDSSGNAKVSFKLPAFQGKLRAMVVGSSKTRTGGASGFTTVRDPLVILSTLPRFFLQSDSFQFPVSITNTSGKPQTVTVNVETTGGLPVTPPKQTVTIANDQQKVLTFAATVKNFNGNVSVKVKAASADGKLNSIEDFLIPINAAGVEQSIRITQPVNKDIPLAADFKDWRPESVRIEALASNSPFTSSLGHLDSLIHYPYGCIEQTTSSTLPLLTMKTLMKWIDPKVKNDADLKDMIAHGINRVVNMQTSSGGFAYWPGGDHPVFWGTAYATAMLLEAKKMGYDVPQASLSSALDYLAASVHSSDFNRVSYNRYGDSAAVPLALFVLAKGGKPITQELRQLIHGLSFTPLDKSGLEGENRFLLAAAAKLAGDQESLRTLSSDSRVFSIALVGARDDEYTYWSPIRSDGLRLSVLEDVFPGHPAGDVLAQRLAAEMSRMSWYYSTQEMAWAVNAIGKRLKGTEKASAASLKNVSFLLNGQKKGATYEIDGAPGFNYEGTMPQKLASAGGPASGGWLHLKFTGIARNPPRGDGKVEVYRSFLSQGGSPLNTDQIAQGDVLAIEVTVNNSSNETLHNVAIVDRVPAGLEIENPRLRRTEELSWMTEDLFEPEYLDVRDDRVQIFGTVKPGKHRFYYQARAVSRGSFTAPGTRLESMYDPTKFFYDKETRVQVVDQKSQ